MTGIVTDLEVRRPFSDFEANLQVATFSVFKTLPSTAINDKTAAHEAKPSATGVIIFDAMGQDRAFRSQRKSI
jgi:hypothetical protein